MRFTDIAAASALVATAAANPLPSLNIRFPPWMGGHGGKPGHGAAPWSHGPGGPKGQYGPGGKDNNSVAPPTNANGDRCLSQASGEEAADVFRQLIQEYSDEVALEYLTEDFVDWSSSVNGIINGGGDQPKDLTKPTFEGRQAFIDGQGSQPEIPFEKIRVWVGCDFVTMRWTTTDSAAGQEVKAAELPVLGNVIITTVPSSEGDLHDFRIKEIFSEFSNAAWLVNLGVFKPDASAIDTEAKKRSVSNLRGNMI